MADGDCTTPVLSLLHVRPLLPAEQASACCNIVNVGENETVNVHGRQYAFDCVVGEGGHPRKRMCEQYIRPLVRNVCNGINCAVFAYGQTSSGKTYTMGIGKEQLQALSSGDEEAVGDLVIPYALKQLFANVEAAHGQRKFTMLVSFVEVYMEKYYDLLARRQPVVAKTRCDGEVMLVGAQLRQVTNMDEVIQLLQIGGLARITKGTNQNERSSRSHAVLTIHVQSCAVPSPGSPDATPNSSPTPVPGSPTRTPGPAQGTDQTPMPVMSSSVITATPTSLAAPPARSCAAVDDAAGGPLLSAVMAAPPLSAKLHLVDLAGSESVGRAGTVGLAAKEGNNINLSLMTLRNLIQMLAAPKAHGPTKAVLPYRDSKLTTLLRDALGGNSSTLFVACVSPADANAAMTVSTLEFATTARRIRTKPAVNIGGAGSTEVLELHRIILRLRSELDQLRRQVLPMSSSPQLQPAMRHNMTFSAAVASASMGPSPLLPSPGQATSGSVLFSHGNLQALPSSNTLLHVSASGHRLSNNSTPVLQHPTILASCGVSGTSGPAHTAAVAESQGASAAWGNTPKSCGRTLGQPYEDRVNPCLREGVAAGNGTACGDRQGEGRTPCSRPTLEDVGVGSHLEPPGDRDAQEGWGEAPPTCGTPLATPGDGADAPCARGLRRSDSGISVASDSSDGADSSLDSVSSYDGSSSGDAQDEWQSVAQLQQRIVLLEAENEHLQKHVGHLSAVIGDLRAQLNGTAPGTAPSPLPLTPGVPRAARSSASGASLLGQSVAALATARLQRMGASVGGVSAGGRSSRTGFSPSQLHGSPFSSQRLLLPPWAGDRVSCEAAGTPSSRPDPLAPRPPCLPLSEGRRQQQLTGPFAGGVPRGHWASVGGCHGLSPHDRLRGADGQSPWSRQLSPGGCLASAASCPPPSVVHASTTCMPIEESPEPLARVTEDPALAATQPEGLVADDGKGPADNPQAGLGNVADDGRAVGCDSTARASEPETVIVESTANCDPAKALQAQVQAPEATEGCALASGPDLFTLPPLDCIEDRMLAMLSWVGHNVTETEQLLSSQQAALRDLLAGQGLTISAGADGLPSWDSLHDFTSQQLAGVEAELRGLDADGQTECCAALSSGAAPSAEGSPVGKTASVSGIQSVDGVEGSLAQVPSGANAEASRRVELLRARSACLKDLQYGLQRATELQASLELQREVQMLVAVYAGLHGSDRDEGGVAAGPAVARAAAAAQQQLQMLRREHRQYILKEAAVAREKLRELEAMAGPPTPQQFGVVLALGGSSSGGGSTTQCHAISAAPSLTLTHSHSGRSLPSWCILGGAASAATTVVLDAGEDGDELDVERGPAAATSPRACQGGAGPAVAGASPMLSPLPPLPAVSAHAQAATPPAPAHPPSLLAQLLPVLSPATVWRRNISSNKETPPPAPPPQPPQAPNSSQQPHAQPPGQQLQRSGSWSGQAPAAPPPRRLLLQLSQLGPWLDALLDYETRLQQYERVLAGALQEREAVYSQLQEVEQELATIADTAFASGFGGSEDPGAEDSDDRERNAERTEGGASFAGWASSPMGTMLASSDPAVQQQAALLAGRQNRLQKRLEELCNEVTSLQMAIVDAQEGASEPTKRDEWWACVPSLGLARPALRLLLERAVEYRAAFQDAMTRACKLEQQVEELGLQYTEAGARLAAHMLELTATRAAALAAMAAPGYTNSIGEAVSALLMQHHQRQQQQQQQQQLGSNGAAGSQPLQ